MLRKRAGDKSLDGLTFLVPDVMTEMGRRAAREGVPRRALSPDYIAAARVHLATAKRARQLGATVIRVPYGEEALYDRIEAEPTMFVVRGSTPFLMNEADEKVRAGSGGKVRRPRTRPLVNCLPEDLRRTPYVLANLTLGQGRGKFLIEHPGQAEIVAQAQGDPHFARILPDLEIRQVIPTAGSHYTSYRVVTGATGEPLAAGLFYSQHLKGDRRVIACPGDWQHGPLAEPTELFATPGSGYFLDAVDVRSNLAVGGRCIPLMGDRRQAITPAEWRILADEGIDPDAPELPEDLRPLVAANAETINRVAGLAVGDDFVRDTVTGNPYHLETNFFVGDQTYAACWLAGQTINPEVTGKAMAFHALDSIARWNASK